MALIRLAPFIALAALLGALWWLWSDRQLKAARIDVLEASVSDLEAAIAQREEAEAVLRAHLEREMQERAETESALEELRNAEGYDAPLSDFLRRADELRSGTGAGD